VAVGVLVVEVIGDGLDLLGVVLVGVLDVAFGPERAVGGQRSVRPSRIASVSAARCPSNTSGVVPAMASAMPWCSATQNRE
jgi:hypothetical protein